MAEEAKKEEKKKPEAEASPEDEGKKGKKKILILALAAGLLIVGGGAAAFFLTRGKKAEADTEIKADEHGAAGGEHGAAEAGHGGEGEHKADAHGGEKKEEGHGDAHGEAKADEHGEKKEDAHGESGHGDGHGAPAAASAPKKVAINIDFGETYKMPSFSLNLGNSLENRYIKLEIELEYPRGEETIKEEIQARLPQLRDAVISIVQRKTREFLLSPDGKEALRKEILIRINRFMSKPITAVYITDFLIE